MANSRVVCVFNNSRIIPRTLCRYHASFENAVLFVKGLKIRLIFSNETTSGSLPVRGQEQMETLHFSYILVH
jgi:hypothetical protein